MRSVSFTRQLAMLVSVVVPCVQCHHRQCHGRVGNVVAIEVDGLERPALAGLTPADVQPVGAAGDVRAHGARGLHKADVALNGVESHAMDADAFGQAFVSRGNGAQRDEVAGRGGVGLHMDVARRAVLAASGNGEALPVLVRDLDAESGQQLQRDGDVGLGDQLAHHVDHDVLGARRQRQRHQQGGEELAGHVAAHADGRGQRQGRYTLAVRNAQRRVAIIAQVVDLATELAQRIDQVADGALVHARHAR